MTFRTPNLQGSVFVVWRLETKNSCLKGAVVQFFLPDTDTIKNKVYFEQILTLYGCYIMDVLEVTPVYVLTNCAVKAAHVN